MAQFDTTQILLIGGGLGLVGWYLWKQNQKSKPPPGDITLRASGASFILVGQSTMSTDGALIFNCVPTNYGFNIGLTLSGTGFIALQLAALELPGLIAQTNPTPVNLPAPTIVNFSTGLFLQIPAGLPLGQKVTLRASLLEVSQIGTVIRALAGGHDFPTKNVIDCAFI